MTGTVTEKLVSFLGEQGGYSRQGGATEREPDVYGHGRARWLTQLSMESGGLRVGSGRGGTRG